MSKKFIVLFASFLLSFVLLKMGLAEISFFEDFEDGVAQDFVALSGDWQVVDGVYICTVDGVNAMTVVNQNTWGDYRLECDVLAEGGHSHAVIIRRHWDDFFYIVNARSAPYNDMTLYKHINGYPIELEIFPTSNTIEHEVWHHISVDAIGNEISAYLDGSFVFSYSDPDGPYSFGGIGLFAHGLGEVGWQAVSFDNVSVEVFVVPNEATSWGEVKALFR